MMIEKLMEGLAAGGPAYALVGIMLWLWVKQSEKHESHWVRIANDLVAASKADTEAKVQLAMVMAEMKLLIERVLPLAVSHEHENADDSKLRRGKVA